MACLTQAQPANESQLGLVPVKISTLLRQMILESLCYQLGRMSNQQTFLVAN